MKLVEVIRTDRVAPRVLATGFAFAKRLKKVPVLSGVCEGFIGNRILTAWRRQCDFMLEDGALPHEIDAAMKDFGLPMGIYEMQDMAGLDQAAGDDAVKEPVGKTRPMGTVVVGRPPEINVHP